eukprot:9483677-Pyramimonas_sp.AAC.1
MWYKAHGYSDEKRLSVKSIAHSMYKKIPQRRGARLLTGYGRLLAACERDTGRGAPKCNQGFKSCYGHIIFEDQPTNTATTVVEQP